MEAGAAFFAGGGLDDAAVLVLEAAGFGFELEVLEASEAANGQVEKSGSVRACKME